MAKAITPTAHKKQPKRKATADHPRPNKEPDIELRRSEVLSYRLRGMTVREIANALGVSKSTVDTDLKALEENWGERIRAADDAVLKGGVVARFQHLTAEALTQFDLQDKGANKAQFLDKAIRSLAAEASFLIKSGVVEGATSKTENAISVRITSGEDIGGMNLLELRALEARLMGQLKDVAAKELDPVPALSGG